MAVDLIVYSGMIFGSTDQQDLRVSGHNAIRNKWPSHMIPLDRITERVNRNGDLDDPATPRPLLTLEEFFDGNDVVGSIGCNLTPTPTPVSFWQTLQQILGRQDVADIRVQVTMFDTPEWPFSDMVWIITSADPAEVESWFPEALRPDECSLGWPEEGAIEPCPVPAGMHPVACWWD